MFDGELDQFRIGRESETLHPLVFVERDGPAAINGTDSSAAMS